MKTRNLQTFLVLMIIFLTCSSHAKLPCLWLQKSQPQYLEDIEKRIYDAFVQSTIDRDISPLRSIENELKKVELKGQKNLVYYWRAYLNYYEAIYYLNNNNNKNSEDACDEAEEWLEKIENKTSEEYALLAMVKSFGIQFKGPRAMFISSEIKKDIRRAIDLDPDNLRAHYVCASNDFYTPKQYGGGKLVEEYLLKAISLPSQKIKNPYLPSWGKVESYTLLVKYYIKTENMNNARKYFKEGIKIYPNSYTLKELATQLID